MARFKNKLTNVVVSVADSKADRYADGWEALDDTPAKPTGYAAQKVAELRDEIERRNEDRSEENLLSTDGNKADLVAILEADDTATGE